MPRKKKTTGYQWPEGMDMKCFSRPKPAARTAAERMKAMRDRRRSIDEDMAKAFAEIDWKRRHAALADPLVFIHTYLLGADGIFKYAPYEETRMIISAMMKAIGSSTPYHIRQLRGTGKTTLVTALTLFCICNGYADFVLLTGSKADLSKSMLEDLWTIITQSDEFACDFPEMSLPMRLADSPNKYKSQTFRGKSTMISKHENIFRLPKYEPCPANGRSECGAIVMSVGFDAKVRGIRIGKRRPNLIILDDLQDDDMANSPSRVESARNKVYKTFLKLNRAGDQASVLMTSTPIRPNDLSETFAADPNWKTETFPMMLAMPTHADGELWKEYKRIKDTAIYNLTADEHPETAFYLEHRAEMDEGGRPMWQKLFDAKNGEVSAIQSAMNLYLADRESFMSECQLQPVKSVHALDCPKPLILSRVAVDSPRRFIPPGFTLVTCATDINPSYALTTCIVAFKPDRTARIIDHFVQQIRIDSALNDTEFYARVFEELVRHGRSIRQLGLPIQAWGIDASGHQFVPVTALARVAASVPDIRLPTCAMTGRAAFKFNAYPRNRLKNSYEGTVLVGDEIEHAKPGSGKKWLVWDADRYKETVQRSFMSSVGAPGGLTLYSDGDHREFAMQVANEQLRGKETQSDGRDRYDWVSEDPHDFLDCLAMCYAIAADHQITGAMAPSRIGAALNARIRRKKKIVIR